MTALLSNTEIVVCADGCVKNNPSIVYAPVQRWRETGRLAGAGVSNRVAAVAHAHLFCYRTAEVCSHDARKLNATPARAFLTSADECGWPLGMRQPFDAVCATVSRHERDRVMAFTLKYVDSETGLPILAAPPSTANRRQRTTRRLLPLDGTRTLAAPTSADQTSALRRLAGKQGGEEPVFAQRSSLASGDRAIPLAPV